MSVRETSHTHQWNGHVPVFAPEGAQSSPLATIVLASIGLFTSSGRIGSSTESRTPRENGGYPSIPPPRSTSFEKPHWAKDIHMLGPEDPEYQKIHEIYFDNEGNLREGFSHEDLRGEVKGFGPPPKCAAEEFAGLLDKPADTSEHIKTTIEGHPVVIEVKQREGEQNYEASIVEGPDHSETQREQTKERAIEKVIEKVLEGLKKNPPKQEAPSQPSQGLHPVAFTDALSSDDYALFLDKDHGGESKFKLPAFLRRGEVEAKRYVHNIFAETLQAAQSIAEAGRKQQQTQLDHLKEAREHQAAKKRLAETTNVAEDATAEVLAAHDNAVQNHLKAYSELSRLGGLGMEIAGAGFEAAAEEAQHQVRQIGSTGLNHAGSAVADLIIHADRFAKLSTGEKATYVVKTTAYETVKSVSEEVAYEGARGAISVIAPDLAEKLPVLSSIKQGYQVVTTVYSASQAETWTDSITICASTTTDIVFIGVCSAWLPPGVGVLVGKTTSHYFKQGSGAVYRWATKPTIAQEVTEALGQKELARMIQQEQANILARFAQRNTSS